MILESFPERTVWNMLFYVLFTERTLRVMVEDALMSDEPLLITARSMIICVENK